MRKQLIRQNELSLRPFILISYDRNEGSYFFRNAGQGPALQVKLEEIPLLEDTVFVFTYKSDICEVLIPGEKSRIIFRETTGEIASAFYLGAISPPSAIKTFDITVTYSSIDDVKYETHGKIGKIGSVFIKTEKVKS